MRWSKLESSLRGAMARPLPGHDAQEALSPRPRVGWEPGYVPDDARDGAALLLLFPAGPAVAEGRAREPPHAADVSQVDPTDPTDRTDQADTTFEPAPPDAEAVLILTLREAGLSKHAGQVSLPGGAAEAGETLVEAALRETHEEIGVAPEQVCVLGTLSPLYIPVSGFALHPFVGVCARRPHLIRDPGEVQRILEIPISTLMDPAALRVTRRESRGRTYRVPFIDVDGERLWGATAMIVAEFLALLGHRPDPWGSGREDVG